LKFPCPPSNRYRPQLAVLHAAVPERTKINEPFLEDGLGHLFQGLVHLAVEFDLVVESGEDGGDGLLLGERGDWHL